MSYDIIFREANLAGAGFEIVGDLAVLDGKIAAIAPNIPESGRIELSLRAHFILPGYIDAHVHLNEPGRADWEGFATGTSALAAGGCTTFLDMPLNSTPPVLDAATFHAKAEALARSSRLNGGIWGGLVPGNVAQLTELAKCGVIGFKAFMSNSGMSDFPAADLTTLRQGLEIAAELGLPVGVHAESDSLTTRLSQERIARGACTARDYLDSRPIEAEVEAIDQAIELSAQTGCALHVVHVSSASGLERIALAKSRGVNVTAETCPHYLLLDEEDLFKLGAAAKCAPPLRPKAEQDLLWAALEQGWLDIIGSDHSPSPPDLKGGTDFFKIWGGMAGCQHNYPLFFEAALSRKISPSVVAKLTAANVAKRFSLANKGDLQIGWDADLTVLKLGEPKPILAEHLLTRHRLSCYIGRETRAEVVLTMTEGCVLAASSAIWKSPLVPRNGRVIRPA